MNQYLKLLELIHKYAQFELWKNIDFRDVFEIEIENNVVFVSILGSSGVDFGLNVYETIEDLSVCRLADSESAIIQQPDYPLHFSCLKVDCQDGKEYKDLDASEKIYEYNIDDDCIAYKCNIGEPIRLVNDEETELLIKVFTFINKFHKEIKALNFMTIEDNQTYLLSEEDELMAVETVHFPSTILPDFEVNYKKDDYHAYQINEKERQGSWAIGIFYAPAIIQVPVPYFPKMCFIYDLDVDEVVSIITPEYYEYPEFPNLLEEIFATVGILPEAIYVANYETLCYFKDVLDEYGFAGEVEMKEELNTFYQELIEELAMGAEDPIVS